MWLSAEEALRRLGVKPQTLYANVSRGRINARPDPADPRRSLYNGADVERLAHRPAGRRRAEAVAAEAIRWGDPILESAISTVMAGRLWYRGQDAVVLAETATLEDIAELLWPLPEPPDLPGGTSDAPPGLATALAEIAERVPLMAPSQGRSGRVLRADAVEVLTVLAGALCATGEGPLHQRLARRWQRPRAADALRRALVLLADHELNASTFAARVAVSTGASLAAGIVAGLATLSGPLHGRASVGIAALADDLAGAQGRISAALRDWLGEGRVIPGFGHPLYPGGDPRAASLLASIETPPLFGELAAAGEALVGERPNVDFALAALAAAHDLPPQAPLEVFALARSVGWLSHMLEQAENGVLIRPRARYTGIRPVLA